MHGPDAICQAGRIIWNGPVVDKPVRRWIQSAYTVLLAHPHVAVSVSIDRINVIRNQAVGIIRVVPIMLKTPSAFIEPNKTAAPATHPEITRCIFVNASNGRAFTQRILIV